MNDQDAGKIIRLLEEIRDGQKLQLERQAQALDRQAELLAGQRERMARLSGLTGDAQAIGQHADQILARSGRLVSGARILVLIALPVVLVLLAFVTWLLIARVVA